MPLLGDEQGRARDTAGSIAGRTFTQIHAFPQKDNPNRRIFRDAKLSTALFVYFKSTSRARVRRHSPQPVTRRMLLILVAVSHGAHKRNPALRPHERDIVSCSQEDWDLAVRIAQRPGSTTSAPSVNPFKVR